MIGRDVKSETRVGIFITVGLAILLGAILLLGGVEMLSRSTKYVVRFVDVSGLVGGAKVELNGLRVGTIHDITYDSSARNVKVILKVTSKYSQFIRKDSIAEIATQGILGDKYIMITAGTMSEPALSEDGELKTSVPRDLKSFLTGGDQLLHSLNSVANGLDKMLKTFETNGRQEIFFDGLAKTSKNLAVATDRIARELENFKLNSSVSNLNEILGKINNGKGTIGALINDPELYDDLRTLLGGVNRNRIVRNLIRQTVKSGEQGQPQTGPAEPGK